MNKEKYEMPIMEVIIFHAKDIILTSGDIDQGDLDPFENMIDIME